MSSYCASCGLLAPGGYCRRCLWSAALAPKPAVTWPVMLAASIAVAAGLEYAWFLGRLFEVSPSVRYAWSSGTGRAAPKMGGLCR